MTQYTIKHYQAFILAAALASGTQCFAVPQAVAFEYDTSKKAHVLRPLKQKGISVRSFQSILKK